MSYIPDKTLRLPVIGLLEKANPENSQTLQNDNIGSISFIDNTNSTNTGNLTLQGKDALVFAQFSREDELDSSTISILVGESNDETRLSRVIGQSSNSIQYRYQSDSIAIDMIDKTGLNIRKHYTDNNTDTIDYGDGCYIMFFRSST